MAELQTTYLGLSLRNPIVVSSCGITGSVAGVGQCADLGAGAVVLKSLFEEQITAELGGEQGLSGSAFPAEAEAYLADLGKTMGPAGYLTLIEECKRTVSIPIIASVNCVTSGWWVDYAQQIEQAGADALELNIALMPHRQDQDACQLEDRMTAVVHEVRARTKLPLAVKIGPQFSALPHTVRSLKDAGAAAVVLFNRFYQLDIDPVELKPIAGNRYSSPEELSLPLRWTAILAPQRICELAVTTGVHSGLDAAKALIAGAQAIQVASALYRRKIPALAAIVRELGDWLDRNGYRTVDSARGALSQRGNYRAEDLERLQYIRALTGIA